MAAPEGNQFWQAREKHGRDRKFSPDQLWPAACEYFAWCDSNPLKKATLHTKTGEIVQLPIQRPYTLKGLCLFLGIGRETFHEYARRKDYSNITTRARDIIYTQKFEGAAVGAFNANLIARDLHLRDTQDVNSSNYSDLTDDELRERINEIETRLNQ